MRQFRMYNSRMDLFDLSENKDFISVNPSGLGVLVENDYHASDTNFVTKKRTMGLGELTLTLVLGHMKDNAYSRYTEFVEFLNHSPYVLVYEFDGREFRRDCVLSELTKSELRMSRTLQESLKLEFTSPFYIERTEQTQPFIPIEGKAGKIYEAVKPERRIFEQLPDGGYRAGDLWHYVEGQDWVGRNLWSYNNSSGGYVNVNTGGVIPQSTTYLELISNFVEIDPSKPLHFLYIVNLTETNGACYGVGMYDKDKNFINRPSVTTGVIGDNIIERMLIYTNETRFIRISFRSYGNAKVKVYQTGNNEYQISPLDLLPTGATEGYFIATKTNTSFDFNDFQFYNTTLETQDKTYDYIYDYTYGPELYLESYDEEFYHLAEYIYDDEGESNSFIIDNNSVYMGLAKSSPCEITIYGPCENPHWDIMLGTEIVQSDGYNLTVPDGYRLVVSSNPQRQRARLIGRDGTVSNVYQQQDLSKTNFVTFPVGRSKIAFFNYDRVTFRYREEYVTI